MEWKEIKFAPFKTFKEEYIICLDTLGQDRQFSDDEKRFTLETIKAYREAWEAREIASLTADRDRKLALMNVAAEEPVENEEQQEMIDELDALELDPDYFLLGVVNDDPVFKTIYDSQKTLEIEAKWFKKKDEWKKVLTNLKSFRVLKMLPII